VDARAGLDDVDKRKFLALPGLELRPVGRPARSQSLYKLFRRATLKKPNDILSKDTKRVHLKKENINFVETLPAPKSVFIRVVLLKRVSSCKAGHFVVLITIAFQ
jgi:hypothetical protein